MGLFFSEHVWDEVVPFPEILRSLCVKLLGLEGSLFSEETVGLVTSWKSLVTKCFEWLLQLVNISYIIILSVFSYLSFHFYAVLPASFFLLFLIIIYICCRRKMLSAAILLNSSSCAWTKSAERLLAAQIYSFAELASTWACCYCPLCIALLWARGMASVSYLWVGKFMLIFCWKNIIWSNCNIFIFGCFLWPEDYIYFHPLLFKMWLEVEHLRHFFDLQIFHCVYLDE